MMRLKLYWPPTANTDHHENFFFGVWHPDEPVRLEWSTPPDTIIPAYKASENWIMVSNISLLHPNKPGLIHAIDEHLELKDGAVAFNGYILNPAIHSFSLSREILDYWLDMSNVDHNGVFSVARILNSGRNLQFVTDAFGISSLYYMRLHRAIIFSSNPRYLISCLKKPDYVAWRSLIQSGYIPSDRSLDLTVKRVSPGETISFWNDEVEHRKWFDYETLPSGYKAVDGQAVDNAEGSFQQAMSRCLRLQENNIVLPLSSGHDSRRILATLLDRGVPFNAITVKVLQKEYRDLDARFATIMANDLKFPHVVIDSRYQMASSAYCTEYAKYDRERQLLLAAESMYHTWQIQLMGSLPKRPAVILDGLAGDALGNSGFVIPHLHESHVADKDLIAKHLINTDFDKIINGKCWPSADHVRQEIRDYIGSLPEGYNQAELAFLLLQTRRSTAISQLMLPAGHIIVYPFLDIDHIRMMLSYHPGDKYKYFLQSRCLEKYWPKLYVYPGSRNIPITAEPGSKTLLYRRDIVCFRQLQNLLFARDKIRTIGSLITNPAKIRFWVAMKNDYMALKSQWAFKQLMEIVTQFSEERVIENYEHRI